MNIAESILMKFKKDVYREKLNRDIEKATNFEEWEAIMNKYGNKDLLTDTQEKIIRNYIEDAKWLEERHKKTDRMYKIFTILTITAGITATLCLVIFK